MKPALIISVFVAAITSVLLANPGQATPPISAIEITPPAIQLVPNKETETDALAVVRNSTPNTIKNVRLVSFPETRTGIKVTIRDSKVGSIPPDGSHAWVVNVKAGRSFIPGKVTLRLDYLCESGSQAKAVPGIATGTLDIQEFPRDPVDKVAELKIESGRDLLEENGPITLFLVVRNISGVPVTVEGIACRVDTEPKYIELTCPDLNKEPDLSHRMINPQASRMFSVGVKAGKAVRVGAQLLLFEVGITWTKAGQSWSGVLTATKKLNVGVIGESDILKLLGVPSFLLLPGFLMVTAFMFLWSHVKPKEPFQPELKTPEFWLIAITLSFFAAPVYAFMTKWLSPPQRNYLVAYGLRDVFWVWLGSVLAAFLAWLCAVVYKEETEHRHVPSPKDDPVYALRKLARNHMHLMLTQGDAQISDSSQEKRYFLISPSPEGQTEVWIAPPILYEWGKQANTEDEAEFEARLKTDDATAMAKWLVKKKRADKIAFKWMGNETPVKMNKNKIKWVATKAPIIREKEEGE